MRYRDPRTDFRYGVRHYNELRAPTPSDVFKQTFCRFGILPTVPAGMPEPHSFATRTAAEYAVGMDKFMLKQTFRDFVFSTNTDGSGKTVSYVHALYKRIFFGQLSFVVSHGDSGNQCS